MSNTTPKHTNETYGYKSYTDFNAGLRFVTNNLFNFLRLPKEKEETNE